MPCEYGLKCMFAPGNKHVLVATTQAHLLLYDMLSNEMVQNVLVHHGSVYSLCLTGNGKDVVTGGVNIWRFSLKMVADAKQLCVALRRALCAAATGST